MASCLLRAIIHDGEDQPLVQLESGFFALREWPSEMLQVASIPVACPVEVPQTNLGLLPPDNAVAELENDDIQFRQAVRLKFEADLLTLPEDDAEPLPRSGEDIWPEKKFENVKLKLNAQQNEHYNVCAAIVKILRSTQTPMRSAQIAQTLSQKVGAPIFEQAAVLAMRADNALRVSRGKRAIFMHISPDMWTLSENFLARHVLKIESRLYDMSRQLRAYSLHALTTKIRELAPQALLQLASIILKHLNYTIQSQCSTTENEFIFRAEEIRGLSCIPVIIKVLHAALVSNDDNECTARECPISAYSARQIAPIMFDARIGVTPNELPIIFIDNNFFQSLSANNAESESEPASENLNELLEEAITHVNDEEEDDLIGGDVSGDSFIFDDSVDVKELD